MFVNFSSFSNNFATVSGGIIQITNKLAVFDDKTNIYQNNSAIYGNIKAAYPIRIVLSAYQQIKEVKYRNYKSLCKISVKTNILENNIAYSLIYDTQICPNQKFSLTNETPGVIISAYLNFRLIDYYNQTVTTKNGSLCFITVKSTKDYKNQPRAATPNLIGFTTTTLINGLYIIIYK